MEKTDEEHGVSRKQIESGLKEAGFEVTRKTFYEDIDTLIDMGYDIVKEKSNTGCLYKVVSREFEIAELKLLVDVVQSSKFITEKKSKALVEKITALASNYQARELKREMYTLGRVKYDNESIYYNLDCIHMAICEDKKVSFCYYKYTYDLKKVLRHGGKRYRISPWAVINDDAKCYLLGFDEDEEKMKTFRIDKMCDLIMHDEKRIGREYYSRPEMQEYEKTHFRMFGGKRELVTFYLKEDMIDVFIDRFGLDIYFHRTGDDEFPYQTKIMLCVSPTFYGWVCSLGQEIKVVGPEWVVEDLTRYVVRIYESYCVDKCEYML